MVGVGGGVMHGWLLRWVCRRRVVGRIRGRRCFPCGIGGLLWSLSFWAVGRWCGGRCDAGNQVLSPFACRGKWSLCAVD